MLKTVLKAVLAAAEIALCAMPVVKAQDAADAMPILRLEPGGPVSFVSAVAFNPQGSTLYAGGWDKVVRAWNWDPSARRFVLDVPATYRVAIGPALEGVINAIAVSPDGMWLAVAGQNVVRGSSDMRRPGWKVPAAGVMDAVMRQDQGAIHLFNTRTHEVRMLRGHTAPVVALSFAPPAGGKPPLLVSAGREWDEGNRKFAGAVRAWDTQRAAYLGGVMLPDVTTRPGIAAWHVGGGLKQLRVAISWGDASEALRMWDVETNSLRSVADGQFNNTAAWWPERSRLITGSTSRLKLWNVSAGGRVERELPLARLDVPRAIALFSSVPGGRADRAAVVVKSGDADATVRLRIVDLVNFSLVEGAQVALWDGKGVIPSVAAVAGGTHLAVAGNHNHEIATFAAGELLAGRGAHTMLRGDGIDARQVSFARRDQALGVIVSPRSRQAAGVALGSIEPGDLVFDPAGRRVTGALDGWRLVRPAADDWRVEVAGGGAGSGQVITIRQRDRAVSQIRLGPARQVSDVALLPPQPPHGVPILALATQELGQPLLELYDASRGTVVRELSGHVAAIEALAFSDDGKLLVSTAGDRTISVWNVADLDKVIAARGALPGVVLSPDGQALVVAEVAADSPYGGGRLNVGDTLVGWVRDGKVEPIPSIVDFYLQVSRVKPGDTIALARRRGGQQAADTLELAVGQGTDERKPLFTLFIADREPHDWIAWSPLGPYESSGQGVEHLLGWHFNTRQPAHPARFATAAEYRHLRREGLIEELIGAGALPQVKQRPLDRPRVSIRLKQSGQDPAVADGAAPLRVVGRQAELELEIRGLEPDQIDQVTWRNDEAQPQKLEPISRQVWTAKLSDLPDERRATRIALAITTAEAEPQIFTEEVSLAYQPLAPAIEQARPAVEHSLAKAAALRLAAQVLSRESPTAKIDVTLTHTAGGREVAKRKLDGAGRLTVDEAFELKPGDNTFTLVASNSGALAGEEELERTVLVRRVTFSPQASPPPELVVEAVSAPAGQRRALSSDLSDPLVVDSPTLSLEGRIAAERPLARAEWIVGDQPNPFTGFVPKAAAKLNVKEQITLVPGRQRIACLAQGERGLPTEVSLMVDYRPRLGQLYFTAPETDSELVEGRDPRRIQVKGRIEPMAEKHPFEAGVLINGQPSAGPVTIDAAGETFSSEVELADGENRIEARLTNAWGASVTSEPARVRYLRPPQVVELSVPKTVDAPLVDVSFVVESPAGLKLTGLKVNDWELPDEAAVIERDGPDTARWKVVARDVPLRQGANEIRPFARNADGWSVVAKTAQVDVMLPPPPRAEIEFLSPAADRTVEVPGLEVRFAVRSESRLKRVELRNGDETVAEIDVGRQVEKPKAAQAGKRAGFLLEADARVTLAPRDNALRVVAVNDGGESQSNVTVTYVRKPVEVVIDRLESLQGTGALTPEVREGGSLRFTSALAEGRVWVEGRVRWPDAATQRLNQVSVVQIWVNGFLQQPVALKPQRPSDLEWKWKAKIRLNRSGDNEVSVRLPGVARAADCRLDFQVKCSKPDERQRLHLLVVGVGEKDARQLETLALRAVRGRRVSSGGDQIVTPAFAKGWIYLVSGYVNRGKVTAQLERIHLRVGDPADAGSDVVMVYYRGQETVDDRGQFYLLTSQSQFDPDTRSSAVSGKDLSERFSSVPGAQLFLLDVQRRLQAGERLPEGPQRLAGWPSQPQMAALRYAWLSNEAAPADARLLVAVDNALPQATRLGEIETAVSQDSQRARQKYGATFQYEPRVPVPLRDLVLTGPVGTIN